MLLCSTAEKDKHCHFNSRFTAALSFNVKECQGWNSVRPSTFIGPLEWNILTRWVVCVMHALPEHAGPNEETGHILTNYKGGCAIATQIGKIRLLTSLNLWLGYHSSGAFCRLAGCWRRNEWLKESSYRFNNSPNCWTTNSSFLWSKPGQIVIVSWSNSSTFYLLFTKSWDRDHGIQINHHYCELI